MRGDGSIFKRDGVYWLSYSRAGVRHQRSARTTDPEVAKKRLQALRKEVERGTVLSTDERRATVDDLLDDLVLDLELRERVYAKKAPYHLKPLRAQFGDLRASALDTSMVQAYQLQRKKDKLAPATVNRECELLRQAFRLAARRQPAKVRQVPYIPLLPIENARQGFVERADFEALLAALRDEDIRDFVEWFWWTGMRPNEIRQLSWEMLERDDQVLNLEPRITKTRRGRAIAITGPLVAVLERRRARRRLKCPLIFHRRGLPIIRFATSWQKALKTAKLPSGLRPYDLRRSAIRNLVRAGVDPRTVMSISGHRTRSTFDRYNITSVEDIRDAMQRVERYVQTLPSERKVSAMQTSD